MPGRETTAGQKGCAFGGYTHSIGQAFYSFLEGGDVTVDAKPNFEACQFEIGEELRFMHGLEAVTSFEFDYEAIGHNEVEAIPAVRLPSPEFDPELHDHHYQLCTMQLRIESRSCPSVPVQCVVH